MTITVYQSIDASAPTLTGTAGSLIAVLDACLVNGYGAKAAAGWSKAYSGTNVAVYRQTTVGHPGHYLHVDDNGPGAGSFREVRVRAYKTMSDVNTGTDPFPTVAQLTNGLFWRKSATLDSTARSWTIIADDATFYILFQNIKSDANENSGELFYFGSFNSFVPSDTSNTYLCGKTTENTSTQSNTGMIAQGTAAISLSTQKYLSTRSDGVLSQAYDNLVYSFVNQNGLNTTSTTESFKHPNPSNGGIIFMPHIIIEDTTTSTSSSNKNVRGVGRGLFAPFSAMTGTNTGDTFQYAGNNYMILKGSGNTTNTPIIVQISGTW